MFEKDEQGECAVLTMTCAYEALRHYSTKCTEQNKGVHSVGQVVFADHDTVQKHGAVVYPAMRGQRYLEAGYTVYVPGVVSVFQ